MLCRIHFRIGDTALAEDPTTPPEAAPETTYDLTLKGAGVTIERKVPQSIALTIIATVMGGGQLARPAQPRLVPGGGAGAGAASTGLTPGEYLSAVEAKRNPDKILAFGAFLMDEMGRETFTRDEVRAMFQSAAEPVPANFHRDFTWAVSNRWLGQQVGAPGAYYVTSTGRTALGNKFSTDVKATTKLARRRRRKGTAAATAAPNDK
jgi:hypothetical protein